MVVEEECCVRGAQAGVGAEEVPDLVEGGLPGVADLGDADVAADRGQAAGGGALNGDVHRNSFHRASRSLRCTPGGVSFADAVDSVTLAG